MTLPRTIKRREQRKRAKLRPKSKPSPFLCADLICRDGVKLLVDRLNAMAWINREY